MKLRHVSTVIVVIALALTPLVASAQQTTFSYDDRLLTSLYEAFLKKGSEDAYLEKRITDERARVRTFADQALQELVKVDESTVVSDTTLTKALDRQRAVVDTLGELLRDRNVDLDLLSAEEKKYYRDDVPAPEEDDTLRLTVSHAELLAKKALLEERIAAVTANLALQQDRLQKLSRQQWLEQFRSLFQFGGYLLIVFGAVALDRLVRRRVAKRFQGKGQSYLIAKLLTAGIYTVATLWLVSKLLSDHPNALASLAIIGAGIAVALQDVLKDLMAWILILQRHLFKLGNRVNIGGRTGDVIDIGPLRTTMLEVSTGGAFNAHERTGKTLYIPNSAILREPVVNYNTTSDFMVAEIRVTMTFDSDWKKAEALLHEALLKETEDFTEQARAQQRRRTALFYTMWEVSNPEVHVDLEASGVLFTLKFTVPIGMRRAIVSKLTRDILDITEKHPDIRLAYNTVHVVRDA